jgi:hypothetical protein
MGAGEREGILAAAVSRRLEKQLMKIPVLVEHLAGGVYRANAGSLFPFTTEGSSADEAVKRLKERIMEQMAAGAHMVILEAPTDAPWLAAAGIFRDDATFDEWQEAIAENRRRDEADANYL